MKNFTQKFIGILTLVFTICFTVNLYSQNSFAVGYPVSAVQFDGSLINTYTVDLYVVLNEDDVLLNVYNYNDINIGVEYFQANNINHE